MNALTNFTVQDVAGSAVAVVVFAAVLMGPGFLLAYASNLFGFRRMRTLERLAWAVVCSFGVVPVAGYLLAKYAGLEFAAQGCMLCSLIMSVINKRGAGDKGFSRREWWILGGVTAGWTAFVVLSLVDWQVGHRLYFSVAEFDQSFRVAFTNGVLRTGVPPANPLYFAGHLQPIRYYYFWYVVCAMVARVAGVSARQAFIAGSVWMGFGLVAMIALYARHFFGWTTRVRRTALIGAALLAVMGADLLPALGSVFGQVALNGEIEWWSIDQFNSWQDSVLWVPHHTAGLLCCLLGFLLFWKSWQSGRSRGVAWGLAGVSFASAVGLSVYVAFGFALLMVAWWLRLVWLQKDAWALYLRGAVVAVAAALVVVMPFLRELMSASSTTGTGSSAQASHLFAISVRRMIDPELVTAMPVFAGMGKVHPVLLDTVIRLLLVLPGLALELGVYAAVLVLAWRSRLRGRDEARDTALYLTVVGLVMVTFVRSSVITNNDFAYRASMLPQFFLLVLAMALLRGWWVRGADVMVESTRWRRRLVYGLMGLGLAGTMYQAVMLRGFVPFEQRLKGNGFEHVAADVYAARRGLEGVHGGVLAFNPVDPAPGSRADVVPPYQFYSRSLLMNADAQILDAEPGCATEFGGDKTPCAEMEREQARVYAGGVSAAGVRDFCARFGVDEVAVSWMDGAWRDSGKDAGWELPVVSEVDGFRLVRCR